MADSLTTIYQFLSAQAAFLALFGAVASFIAGFTIKRAMRDKKSQLEAEIQGLNDERTKTLREMLQEARTENQILKEKLDRIEVMLDDLEAQLVKAQKERDALAEENQTLKQQIATLQAA